MAQLRRHAAELEAHELQVLVLGPERAETFRNFWERESMPFVGLPDPEHTVARLYGQESKLLKLGRMPAQMLVDKQGVLRFVHYGSTMADIPKVSEMLRIAAELEQQA